VIFQTFDRSTPNLMVEDVAETEAWDRERLGADTLPISGGVDPTEIS